MIDTSALTPQDRLIVALDYPDVASAVDIGRKVVAHVGMLKVGLELFTAAGPTAIAELRALGARVFYDAKLYDIPNTVAGAAAAAGRLGLSLLNVHALGGTAMMRAAKEGAVRGAQEAGLPPPLVIGVTIVTSLSDREVRQELGLREGAPEAALRLAVVARDAGLDGVVCSALEVREIKQRCGRNFVTVTPGIRPAGAAVGDQARVATPRGALLAGADYLVIGRPITRAADPVAAIAGILREIAHAANA
jgi:orotidine-5'-phosphate decarboxylase